jgi:hypothetical protein
MSTEHHDRSIAAQVRAVEEGHRALLSSDQDGPFVKVVSDSSHGKFYAVRARRVGAVVQLTCKPNDLGQDGRTRDHGVITRMISEGEAPCKHMALALRRLERAGLVRWVDPHVHGGIAYAGRWVSATPAGPVPLDAEALPCDAVIAERKATDSQGYRSAMRTIDPLPNTADADPFASFPKY